jgi:hypothetical protein
VPHVAVTSDAARVVDRMCNLAVTLHTSLLGNFAASSFDLNMILEVPDGKCGGMKDSIQRFVKYFGRKPDGV